DLLDAILGRATNSLPACFVAEQMEFVSHIFFDAASGNRDFDLARSIALALNPRAKLSPLDSAAVKMCYDLPASSFDFEAALSGAVWSQLRESTPPSWN